MILDIGVQYWFKVLVFWAIEQVKYRDEYVEN